MKMAQLQSSDKDVIDALTKKLNTMKIDYDTIQQKYQSLLRNYEGVSNYAASDKAEYTKLKTGRDLAEKEASELKKKVDFLEA
jgi:hypothetical protein